MSPSSLSTQSPRPWKGKGRQHQPRQEGPGGSAGVVLSLQLLSNSLYESVYTLPVLVGSSRQNLSLQVDTGSSDLWIASRSCSSSSCGGTDGHLYDPSYSTSSNETVSINYARGEVSGPIVWDSVELGGYNVTNQALAAVSSVSNEPLEDDFSGILGLALPMDSEIAQRIPSGSGSSPNGAAFVFNLFSMIPSDSAPSAPFLSLALQRPGSNDVPSVLGIGRHPEDVVSDPSTIQYAGLVTTTADALFWEASVRAITVYVNGQPREIELGPSVSGAASPSAVLDSGTPVILASSSIANGIYGALGIDPSADGNYYVPCTTPINMTITLDDRTPIPLHPLDLSYPANGDSSACIGLIQNSDIVGSSYIYLPDLILGVPFLRNTYTVMAYEPPGTGGIFSPNATVQDVNDEINPYLGLLGITNITQALSEFNTVRVMNEPLDPTAQSASTSSPSKHLSVGIDVLLGCIGFLGLCFVIFGTRWLYMRRRWRRRPSAEGSGRKEELPDIGYILARRPSFTDRYSASEDTLRTRPVSGSVHKLRRDVSSQYTDDTLLGRADEVSLSEFGLVRTKGRDDSPDRSTLVSWGRDSMFASQQRYSRAPPDSPPRSPPDSPGFLAHRAKAPSPDAHQRVSSDELGLAMPLLVHTRRDSYLARSEDVTQLALGLDPYPEVELERPRSSASVSSLASGDRPRAVVNRHRAGSAGSSDLNGADYVMRPLSANVGARSPFMLHKELVP